MTSASRFPLLAASFFGLTGVALGALGAHALAAELASRGTAHAWETAARYHLVHALALLGLGVWAHSAAGTVLVRLRWAARCWCTGVVLFSGSLYPLALGGPRWLGPITPLGGLAFMAGWLLIGAAALAKEKH
jgi:uncharacterized membrane protein YgdD (TMEM256/DUF423 family)